MAVAAAWSAAAWACCGGVLRGGDLGDDGFVCVGDHVQRRHLLDELVGRLTGQEGGEPGLGLAGVAALGDRPQLRLVGGQRGVRGGGAPGGGRGRGLLLGGDGHLGLVHLLVDER